MYIKRFSPAILSGLLLLSSASQAGLISADFRTEGDLPDFPTSVGPLVYESNNQLINSSIELNTTEFLENPSNFFGGLVFIDIDPVTNILTLDSQDQWDFQVFIASITNIEFDTLGEYISSVSIIDNNLTSNNLTDLGLLPTIAFTENSLSINYSVTTTEDYFYFTGGSASFQLETSVAAVPEPSSLGLLVLGLASLVISRRTKRR